MFAISFDDRSIPARFPTLDEAKAAALEALKAEPTERQALIFDLGDGRAYWFDSPSVDYPIMRAAATRRPLRGVRVVDYE